MLSSGDQGNIVTLCPCRLYTYIINTYHCLCTLREFSFSLKEYIERRHGEPFKFLLLPRMGILGSLASTWKKVQFWIMSNFLAPFFQLFMAKKVFFNFFYIIASALKSCLIKKFLKIKKKLWIVFFRASCLFSF